MIITFQSELEVTDLDGTIAAATVVWREFLGHPETDEGLPWNATIQVVRAKDGELTGMLTAEINNQSQ